jgi:5-methylcytosine-specific restriction endonuclease McrA
VALAAELGTAKDVAVSLGLLPQTLNMYLKRRPDLGVAFRAVLQPGFAHRPLPREPRQPRTTNYPPDEALVVLAAEAGTFNAIARRCGVARESLRDYLACRPALEQTVRAHLHPGVSSRPFAPAERLRRNRESGRRNKARRRRENPEREREINRRWARNMDPARRRFWNNYNRMRRLSGGVADLDPFAAVVAGDPCSYCGGPGGEVDHVDPVSAGGVSDWTNLTGACRSCNARKNARPLLAFLLSDHG